MATPKNPGRAVSIRVAQGSALERMTSDRPFTAAVHQMAELLEKVFAEGWGPPAVPHTPPAKPANYRYEDVGTGYDPGAVGHELMGRRSAPEPERVFQLVEPDGRSTRTVSQSEVLRLAAEQYPAGLVPVGLDEGDDAPADLSHLA